MSWSLSYFAHLLVIITAYYIPNWDLTAKECKTNQPNHSPVRAPGEQPSIYTLSMRHWNFSQQILT